MKIFFLKILSILFIFITLSSCAPNQDPDYMNAKFRETYSDQVEKILKDKDIQRRSFDTTSTTKQHNFNTDPKFKLYSQPSQIFSNDAPSNPNPIFETHKLYLKQPKPHYPTAQTYQEGLKNSAQYKIPDDIFDIKYNTSNHPPFQITGIDFDIIVVPQKDAFGVSSSLNEKQYPIVGNNYVTRNVNSIMRNRSEEDIEFTEELITQQKLIRKQIAVNNLYESDEAKKVIDKNSYDYDNTKEEWAIQKRKIRNDPLNKIIASQIVSRNLKTMKKAQVEAKNNQKQGGGLGTVEQRKDKKKK